MQFDNSTYKFQDSGKFGRTVLIIGVVGLILSLIAMFVDRSRFLFSWLTAFTFWVSIGFGGLFFVMLHHSVNATWSVVLRRMSEAVMMALPILLIFALPIFFGMSEIYEWVDINKPHGNERHAQLNLINQAVASEVEITTTDEAEEHQSDNAHQAHIDLVGKKAGFLNVPFFIIRTLIYFAIWTFLAIMLWRISIRQDKEGYHESQTKKLRMISAPGIIVYALTVTFAGFDWMMSLMPAWYSTIYGLYYFAGGLVAVLAFFAVVAVTLNKNGILNEVITEEHYHDIGKLMFAFMAVWAYFAFSQYLLIWYANIPEETIYYHQRWVGSWKIVSVLIPIAHFCIPFVLLMSRHVKRNVGALRFFAVWLLVMHWVDLYWNIMPIFQPKTAMLSWMDLTSMMGIGGIFLFIFWKHFTQNAVITINDPKLAKSISFENV